MTTEELIDEAIAMTKRSYAPYSRFHVGAALLTSTGRLYTGANVENASYGATMCAERSAIFKAANAGERQIVAIAVAGGANGEITGYCAPCGVCRQVMREFADPKELKIYIAKSRTDYKVYTLDELLPESFGPESI